MHFPVPDAQGLVDNLADRTIPLVWEGQSVRRVLDTSLKLWEQVIILLAPKNGNAKVSEVLDWTDYGNKSYLLKTLRQMHETRLIELSKDNMTVEILPPDSREGGRDHCEIASQPWLMPRDEQVTVIVRSGRTTVGPALR